MLLFCFRRDEITDDHPLRDVLLLQSGLPAFSALQLSGLDASAVSEIASSMLDGPNEPLLIDPELVRSRAAGNPFFIRELVHQALRGDAIQAKQRPRCDRRSDHRANRAARTGRQVADDVRGHRGTERSMSTSWLRRAACLAVSPTISSTGRYGPDSSSRSGLRSPSTSHMH